MRRNTSNTFFPAQSAAGMSNMFMIIATIAIFVFFYFSMIEPQKRQQQERMKMMFELKKGDQVIMADSFHDRTNSVNDADKTIVIGTDGISLIFGRTAIRRVLPIVAAPVKDVKINEAREGKAETEEKPTENSKPEETTFDKTDDTSPEDK